MSFTHEDAADMVEELPPGKYKLKTEALCSFGLAGGVVEFDTRQDAMRTVFLLRAAFQAGQSLALRQVREALGIRI